MFTISGAGPNDYFQVGISDTNDLMLPGTPKPSARDSNVVISLSCASVPVLGVSMSHVGNAAPGGFMNYTITPSVTNSVTTNAPLTANVVLPQGMTLNSLYGFGWTCSISGQTGSCTRTGSFGPGTGPVINMIASFAPDAPTTLIPNVILQGGGASVYASASDPTIVSQAPIITGLSSNVGPVSGGVEVTISGTNLANPTGVTFGGVAATSFTAISDNYINAVTPPGSGTVDVRVTTAEGTSASAPAAQYRYTTLPYARPRNETTAYNTPLIIDLSTTINGVYDSINTFGAVNGTVSFAAPIAVFAPTDGYFGPASFYYSATGPEGSSGAQVSITVSPPTVPVTADINAGAVAYDGSKQIDVSSALTGPYSAIVIVDQPQNGAASVSGTSITYTPTTGYYGPDSFTYRATGAGGDSVPGTISVVVDTPPAPTVSNVSGVAIAYGSTGQTIDLAPAVSGVSSSLSIGTVPARGIVKLSGTVATYTPNADYYGADSFTFTATGPGGTSAPATVSVVVATPAAPTIDAPTEPFVSPPATGGGSAPVTVNLGERTEGVIDGYRVTVDARYGSAEITSSNAALRAQSARSAASSPQAAEVFQLVYTPAPNFMGEDTVTLVAYGPGGDSAPVTFTFQVAGKAPDLAGQVASNASVSFTPTATLVGGPFEGLRITRAPAFGAATVDGLNLVFTPGAENGGTTSLDYVVELGFGSSVAGRIDLTSNAVPGAQALVAETVQGHPVTVRISDTTGGPFTGAAVTAISPTTAGTATISGANGVYDLTFTPEGLFEGEVEIDFTLTNAGGTTAGTLSVTVAARPDPSLDPEVRGLATSQVTTARRFADTQIDNFQRRLEALRSGTNVSSNGLSLNFGLGMDNDDRDPRVAMRRQFGLDQNPDAGPLGRDREREMLGLNRWADGLSQDQPGADIAEQANAAPVSGGDQGDGQGASFGVWTTGSVDWGRQDASGTRDSRFTTQGVTVGMDVKLSDRLIVGAGMGYGEDKTRIGDNGSISRGQAVTGAAYASWRPNEAWFVDGVVGLSNLDFDSRRWAAGLADQADGYVEGERSGKVRFVAASVGRSLRRSGQTTDLYARLESRDITLDGFTETGSGISALVWDDMDQSSMSINLGASWRWSIESRRYGRIAPSARFELSRELEDIGTQGVRYADWVFSPTYLVQLDDWSRNSANMDLRLEWSLSERLMFSLGYRGMLGDASTSHGGQIGLKFGW